MLIKQDFYFHALNAHRPLHIRVPDFGEGPFPVMYFFGSLSNVGVSRIRRE